MPSLGVLLGGFALELAHEDIGKGEDCDHGGVHKNNCGPYVRLVRGDDLRDAWCAAAVSYWFRGAATQLDVRLPFTPSLSARRLFKRMVAAGGTIVKLPQAGDVALWSRPPNPFSGHIGIVSRVEAPLPGAFFAIEANVGPRAVVAEFPHRVGEKRLLGFVRL